MKNDTPLHIACRNTVNTYMASLFIKKGANRDITNKDND